jgi:hypothetical protein
MLDGTSLEGDLTLDNGVMVRGVKTVRVPFASILRATFTEGKGEAYQPGLVLVNGTRLTGGFSSLAETKVQLESSGLVVPGAEIAWAVYQPFSDDLAAQIPRGKVGMLLPGGDFFEGNAKGADTFTAKVLNPIFGPHLFDARKKEMLALILRPVTPAAAGFEVSTADGSVFEAKDVGARDPTALVLRHPLYDGMKVDVKNLVELRAAPGRYAALDSLKPATIEPPAGHTAEQSYAADKTLDGSPLQLGGKPVRGFASLAGCAITWELPAGAAFFVARVAASPATPAAQKLIFAISADGKTLARSGLLGAGDSPAVLRCALPATAKLLSVRAEGLTGSGIFADPVVLRR